MEIANMKKIKLIQNQKIPSCVWINEPDNQFSTIDSTENNVGLICGTLNNIIVLDVDKKDNGIEEMEIYYQKYGQIETLKQSSVNGGYHLFFKYISNDEDDQYLIDNFLLNKSKYRNKGLDIRSNGGYIVISPSTIDGKHYKFVNESEIIEMPHTLIKFLLETEDNNNKTLQPYIVNPKDYVYELSDTKIYELLIKLDDSYLNETKKWKIITHILKGLDKKELWNNWSTMSTFYDEQNNFKIWNLIDPMYDINYICYKLKVNPINRYKIYEPLTNKVQTNLGFINKRIINEKYIQLNLGELKHNDTIIMKSTTGTGKTTTTAHTINEYINTHQHKKILSIVSKKSLCDQHIKSFKDANINLTSYLDTNKNVKDNNIIVCINSILILSKMRDIEFSNYIVYIDEISSFLNDLTHNDTLKGKLKLCNNILMRIIKNCHKLILSDAKITDNVFNFVKTRSLEKNKITYIENNFLKYKDVPAVRIRDEQLYLDTLINHVETNDFFLCASDSCSKVTGFYLECRKYYNNDHDDIDDKFLLITKDSPYVITDASIQFKNKFVFYSPTIQFGVDFSIEDPQDVFIYNKGLTIDPSAIFQQTTRTRNIKSLYYYSELYNKLPKYSSLDKCKSIYENLCSTSDEINEVCIYSDENDNEKIVKNTFFELFVYNEYIKDIYSTNKTSHYQNILLLNGFILREVGTVGQKLDKEKAKEIKQQLLDIKEQAFDLFIEYNETDNILINEHIDLLNLNGANKYVLINYKDQILDKFKLEEHLNIIRILKADYYINDKITRLEMDNYTVTNLGSVFHKIRQISLLSKSMNLSHRLEVNKVDFTFVDISDNQYKLISKIFRISRNKPTNKYTLMKLYVTMIKNVTSHDLIISKYGTSRKTRDATYSINTDLIKHLIELNKYSNKYLNHYDKDILNSFKIEIPCIPIIVEDENNDIKNNTYLLDKDIFDD